MLSYQTKLLSSVNFQFHCQVVLFGKNTFFAMMKNSFVKDVFLQKDICLQLQLKASLVTLNIIMLHLKVFIKAVNHL